MYNYSTSRSVSIFGIEKDPKRQGVILFPLFNLLSFVSAFFIQLRAGALAGIIIFCYVVTHKRCLKSLKEPTFLIFFFVNVFSIYAYAFNGRPMVIYASCITYNLLPMLMYGIGKANTSEERKNPVLRTLLISNAVIVLVGFMIYFSPGLAAKVGMDSMLTAGISATGKGYRFGSYLGSLELGSICAISIPLLLMHNYRHKLVKPVMLIVFAVALLLTMQRGAWIVGIVSIIACMIVSAVLDREGFKSILMYTALCLIVMFVLTYFIDHYMSAGLIKHLEIRLRRINVESLSVGRSQQASNAIELFYRYPFGFGLGAAGNKASPYHMQVIPDGNLLRILVESGFIGMFSFAALNIRAIYNGIKHKYYYMTIIIGLFLAHAIGSNVLDFYYGSFVYWYILGVLNRTEGWEIQESDNGNKVGGSYSKL